MKKGFTLVEMIGVITLVAIITLIALPPVLNKISTKKNDMIKSLEQNVVAASKLYIDDNKGKFKDNKTYCIKLTTLVDEEYLTKDILSTKDLSPNFTENGIVRVVNNNGFYDFNLTLSCMEG